MQRELSRFIMKSWGLNKMAINTLMGIQRPRPLMARAQRMQAAGNAPRQAPAAPARPMASQGAGMAPQGQMQPPAPQVTPTQLEQGQQGTWQGGQQPGQLEQPEARSQAVEQAMDNLGATPAQKPRMPWSQIQENATTELMQNAQSQGRPLGAFQRMLANRGQ